MLGALWAQLVNVSVAVQGTLPLREGGQGTAQLAAG